ncbi:MAG: beta-galactosidase [Verrucomicrobia bacterium]|nr:beta-galactosidase [Verrucomicrobiota bacterium]
MNPTKVTTQTIRTSPTSNRTVMSCLLGGLVSFCVPLSALGAEAAAFTAHSSGKADIAVSHGGADYFRFGTAAWGPNWAWTGVQGQTASENGATIGTLNATVGGTPLRLSFRAGRIVSNRLELNYELKAEKDADLTLFVVEVAPGDAFSGREVMVESQGKQVPVRVPFGKRAIGEQVVVLRWTDASGGNTLMRFDPPCEIAADGALRIVLAKERLAANTPKRLTATVELPATTDWYPSLTDVPDEPGLATWYPWRATGDATDSAFSMADWLEKPAGKHGRIKSVGDELIYNAKPIKLWGLNLCYGACSPEKSLADKRAAFYPRYGINTVRLHKFADGTGWAGIQSKESAAEYDTVGLDRLDYQIAKFKEAGIYVKLSAHFGTIKLGPADRRDVPFLDEFGSFDGKRNERVTAAASAFFYSPELQNLHIRQIVNLLQHTNPHTGLAYAKDPAVCAVEIINEQSVMFYTSMAPLKQSATIRKRVGERFSDWLTKKYGSHDGLVKTWGAKALDGFEKDGFPAGERLDKQNLLPLGNPWYWDPEQLAGSQAFRKQRLLDTLQFLYELQCEAYDRYVAAVRKAGYDGEILGSNWQAGRAYSHFANLHTDARMGLIDRHNYFGGGRGGTGKFGAASMLARAGSGSLSSGLQQVDDRPFMLSEWIHVFPNEWGVEGPAIIGAYGMGLQGWDVSYLFQNSDNASFSRQLGGNAWDVMAPQILGAFPAIARQVLRGDVRESDVVAVRNVHVPSLFEGKLGFDDKVKQGYDDKELDSSAVSAKALAAARCTVRFTENSEATPAFDLKPFQQDGFIVSSTKQLRWKEGTGKTGGFFTMDTDGTKAVVGFAQGQPCRLGEVTITPQSRFAAIYVSAPEQEGKVATSRRLLVTALARARNTGMKFSVSGDELLDKGKGPVVMEPVKATIALAGRRVTEVRLLDHDGRRTEKTVPVTNGQFILDGGRDPTPYCEVILE